MIDFESMKALDENEFAPDSDGDKLVQAGRAATRALYEFNVAVDNAQRALTRAVAASNACTDLMSRYDEVDDEVSVAAEAVLEGEAAALKVDADYTLSWKDSVKSIVALFETNSEGVRIGMEYVIIRFAELVVQVARNTHE